MTSDKNKDDLSYNLPQQIESYIKTIDIAARMLSDQLSRIADDAEREKEKSEIQQKIQEMIQSLNWLRENHQSTDQRISQNQATLDQKLNGVTSNINSLIQGIRNAMNKISQDLQVLGNVPDDLSSLKQQSANTMELSLSTLEQMKASARSLEESTGRLEQRILALDPLGLTIEKTETAPQPRPVGVARDTIPMETGDTTAKVKAPGAGVPQVSRDEAQHMHPWINMPLMIVVLVVATSLGFVVGLIVRPLMGGATVTERTDAGVPDGVLEDLKRKPQKTAGVVDEIVASSPNWVKLKAEKNRPLDAPHPHRAVIQVFVEKRCTDELTRAQGISEGLPDAFDFMSNRNNNQLRRQCKSKIGVGMFRALERLAREESEGSTDLHCPGLKPKSSDDLSYYYRVDLETIENCKWK